MADGRIWRSFGVDCCVWVQEGCQGAGGGDGGYHGTLKSVSVSTD